MDQAIYTPPELAKLWRVGIKKVLGWIRRGELCAIDLAEPGGRHTYRIRAADKAAFENGKTASPPASTKRRTGSIVRHFR